MDFSAYGGESADEILCRTKDFLCSLEQDTTSKRIAVVTHGGIIKAIISVIGKDKVGIIYGVTKVLSENNVNVLDISQTIMQDMFTMMMLVECEEESSIKDNHILLVSYLQPIALGLSSIMTYGIKNGISAKMVHTQ